MLYKFLAEWADQRHPIKKLFVYIKYRQYNPFEKYRQGSQDCTFMYKVVH